jgi:excisionase family DNA binding protein
METFDGPPMQPMTVRIKEASRLTGIGRSKIYELIAAGEIGTVKIGAITLLRVGDLADLLERHARKG